MGSGLHVQDAACILVHLKSQGAREDDELERSFR
jgi:hypothetical protein